MNKEPNDESLESYYREIVGPDAKLQDTTFDNDRQELENLFEQSISREERSQAEAEVESEEVGNTSAKAETERRFNRTWRIQRQNTGSFYSQRYRICRETIHTTSKGQRSPL